DWSEEIVAATRKKSPKDPSPKRREWEERSRHLYEAFIEHPELVEKYCRASLVDALQLQHTASLIAGDFGLPEPTEVLAEAIKFLSPDDAEYWEERIESDLLESAELITDLFQSSIHRMIQNLDTGEEIEECEQPTHEPPLQIIESFGEWC